MIEITRSLSEWVACLIADAVRKKTGRAEFKKRAMRVLDAPLELDGRTFSRDELHER